MSQASPLAVSSAFRPSFLCVISNVVFHKWQYSATTNPIQSKC
jgi:hypothetical protein